MAVLLSPKLNNSHLLRAEPFHLGGGSVHNTNSYLNQIRLGKPGKCPEKPVLVIKLFDNSGSITGGNDCIGQRFSEAELAIQRVGKRCKCGHDLCATLHFDTPTSGDLVPTPITRQNFETIGNSLAVPPDGAGISCLGPSLMAAYELANRYPSHDVVLVVLTDFLLFDDFLDAFLMFPGSLHAVSLTAPPPANLLDSGIVTVTPVDHSTQPGAVARAIFRAMVATRPNAAPVELGEALESSVEAA